MVVFEISWILFTDFMPDILAYADSFGLRVQTERYKGN